MEKEQPQIIIIYNRFLDPIFTFYCKNNLELKESGWNDWIPPTKKKVLERVNNYKIAWKRYEKKILNGLCNATGLNFRINVIYAHIVSGNPRQFSNPIVIKSSFEPDEFIDTLTHELIHILFSQNADILKKDRLKEMFPNESDLTRSHVITHAILKYIYLDILKDEKRLKRNLIKSKLANTNDYTHAWEIVKEKNYLKLIEEHKSKIIK